MYSYGRFHTFAVDSICKTPLIIKHIPILEMLKCGRNCSLKSVSEFIKYILYISVESGLGDECKIGFLPSR